MRLSGGIERLSKSVPDTKKLSLDHPTSQMTMTHQSKMEAHMKRWAQRKDEDFVRPVWVRVTLNKLSQLTQWDTDSAQELLDLCSKTRMYPPLYYKIDTDLSTWGVNQEGCKELCAYMLKFF